MVCGYCKSDMIFLKENEGKTGMYCQNCGRWLKWISDEEKLKVMAEIDKRKRQIVIDGSDFEMVKEKYNQYKKKSEKISEDVKFFKQKSSKNKLSEIEASAMYEKVLKLKELNAKLVAYDEVLMTLRLK